MVIEWECLFDFQRWLNVQKGLVSYIKRYEYKNAKTEDLWSVLAEETGEPVKELMDSWTKQQGYPVIQVSLKSEALVIEQVIWLHFSYWFRIMHLWYCTPQYAQEHIILKT